MLSSLLLLHILSHLALAQQTDHKVLVGGGTLAFSPANFSAAMGDTVTFVWGPPEEGRTNHSVTQSTFTDPCEPLVNTTTDQRGFDSAYVPVTAGSTEVPSWTLLIESTSPIWFFCAQSSHCQQGMVGAINAPLEGNRSFEAFQAAARGSDGSGTAGRRPVSSGVGAGATGRLSSVSDIPSATSAAATVSSASASVSASASGSSAGTLQVQFTRAKTTAVVVLALVAAACL
ncbi:hypothetical protein JCM8547_004494 [Rhodosporidiobolus lusitaniae]